MLRRLGAFAIGIGMSAAAFGAEAADGGHGEASVVSWSTFQFVMAIVVFCATFFILSRTAWPKILKGLEEREQKILAEIEAAERARRQADAALKEYEKSLAEARAEATKMLEQARADQQKFAAELRSKSDAELVQLRERANRDIESAKREAVNEIYAHAAAIASELASKILEREINPEDHQRLIDESLGRVPSIASAS